MIKTCAVEYLNTKPIIYGLQHNRMKHRFDIQFAVPSVCAEKLKDKSVDLALIPSIEFSRIRQTRALKIVPEVAVTSRDEVKSVELFFNKNLQNIDRVAVDTSSRTSVALLQIILKEKFDLQPELIPMSPDLDKMLGEADAALIIGDRALAMADRLDNRLDLGEEWSDLTDGLPFVYSFWAADEAKLSADDVQTLGDSMKMGLQHLDEISEEYRLQSGQGFSAEFFRNYLSENIYFQFGKYEIEGLREYFSYCYYHGLIDEIPEIIFFEDSPLKKEEKNS